MKGMTAENERAKIMERNRRGKIHTDKRGLTKAPYGYLYISKQDGAGQALYEIHVEEAEAVKKIFS